jgi:hypothetical protein
MIITVHVKPGSKRPGFCVLSDTGVLHVHVKARPEAGKANVELISHLSRRYCVAKSDVRILRGHKARIKHVEITGDQHRQKTKGGSAESS